MVALAISAELEEDSVLPIVPVIRDDMAIKNFGHIKSCYIGKNLMRFHKGSKIKLAA